MQRFLDEAVGTGAPVVDAALSAPLNVGGPEFVGLFNQHVNARRVVFQYDVIPQVGGSGSSSRPGYWGGHCLLAHISLGQLAP